MSAKADGVSTKIEPFDPTFHRRETFRSGTAAVDNFLRQTANKLSAADNLRLFVLTDTSGGILGFYALNAHSVDYGELPSRFARTRPSHGRVPAAFISMMGVNEPEQGMGWGSVLLADALLRIARASEGIGIAVVLLDILDDGNGEAMTKRRQLYERFGFVSLPTAPSRMFLPVATVRKLLAP